MHVRKTVTTVNKHLYNNKLDIIYRGCEYMHSNRALRASLLSFLLVLGSFTAFIAPTVCAEESTSGETTLYFKDALSFENYGDDGEYGDFFGLTPVSQTPPTKQNDSEFPPSLIIKDTSKLLPKNRYTLNSEEWILWLSGWALMFLDDLEGFNLSELFDLFGDDLEGYDMDLLVDLMFQNPLRIVEVYEYDGNESIEINEDVIFDLYFSSKLRRPKLWDDVEIGLYSMNIQSIFPLPKLIKNTTVQIKPKILSDEQEIVLENISYILGPGESLLFSIKIIPSKKPISWLLERETKILDFFGDIVINFIKNQENNTKRPKLQDLAILVEEFQFIFEEFNITKEDAGMILDAIKSSSFLYDSVSHPSSVTVPFTVPNDTENTKVYYLHDGNIMDTSQPSGTEIDTSLSSTALVFNGQTLGERNKIITDITTTLYLKKFLGKKQVTAVLYDNDESTQIASSTQEVGPSLGNQPTIFTFGDLEYELVYGNTLNLGVALANGSRDGLFKTKLLYDSETHPSSVTVTFTETNNIQFEYSTDPEDELIIPGGELQYTLSIQSLYDDEIDLDISDDKTGEWSYSIVETLPISIKAGETEEINVIVKSENNKEEAYGDEIDLTFEVSGKTGIDKKTATALVDQEAIEYNIGIYGQDESKNIKKGNSGTFYFVIENKNIGAIDDEDSYTITASSKNDWELKFTDSTPSLVIGEKTDSKRIFVKVYVPENTTIDSDVITVTVTSDNNPEASEAINVTVNVLQLSIFENIVEFFKSAANSLGLDDMFGSKAPYVLAGILAILIVLIILILIFLLRRKSVKIICTDRIQEIDPSEEAVFDITLNNPTRKTKTYEITSKVSPESSKWQTATDVEKITIAARSSKQILLVAKPEETVESNDWTEVKLNVSVSGKKKSEEITTMVMAKDGKTLLRIKDVFSWPREFKKGDRIITSFILENKGNISARNVKVVLFINGKQKNKVEVTIPRGGYADIKIPWIALKGKNELQLKAIEQ